MSLTLNPFTGELDYYESIDSLVNTIIVKTDTYSIEISDCGIGKIFLMNSADAKIFNLPSVGIDNVGLEIVLGKIGTGKLTILAADADKINDSLAGGTLYNALADETWVEVKLKLITETQWTARVVGTGWITT